MLTWLLPLFSGLVGRLMAVCSGISLAPASVSILVEDVWKCVRALAWFLLTSLWTCKGHIVVCPGISLAPAVASPFVAEGIQ